MKQNRFNLSIATGLLVLFFAFVTVPSIVQIVYQSNPITLVDIPEEDSAGDKTQSINKILQQFKVDFNKPFAKEDVYFSSGREHLYSLHSPTPNIPPPELF